MGSRTMHLTRQAESLHRRGKTKAVSTLKAHKNEDTSRKNPRPELLQPENTNKNSRKHAMSLGVSLLLLNNGNDLVNKSVFNGLDKKLEILKRKKTLEAKQMEMEWLQKLLDECTHLLQNLASLAGNVIPDVEQFRKLVELKQYYLDSQNAFLELQKSNLRCEVVTVEKRRLEMAKLKGEMVHGSDIRRPQFHAREKFVEMREKINSDRDMFLRQYQHLLRVDEINFGRFREAIHLNFVSLGDQIQAFLKCEKQQTERHYSLFSQKNEQVKYWEGLWSESVRTKRMSNGLETEIICDLRFLLKDYWSGKTADVNGVNWRQQWKAEIEKLVTQKTLEAKVQTNLVGGTNAELMELSSLLNSL